MMVSFLTGCSLVILQSLQQLSYQVITSNRNILKFHTHAFNLDLYSIFVVLLYVNVCYAHIYY